MEAGKLDRPRPTAAAVSKRAPFGDRFVTRPVTAVRSSPFPTPSPNVRLACVLLLALASGAAAQPAPDVLVDTWRAAWLAAARPVARVEADETLSRRIVGPREALTLDVRSDVAYDVRRPGARSERRVRSATLDGTPVSPERVAELDRRFGRAFGSGPAEAADALVLFPPPLERGVPVALALDALDGRPAWRVDLRMPPPRGPGPRRGAARRGPPPPDRAEAWFTRSAGDPRLLRVRVAGGGPGASVERTVEYERTDGLDVPAAMRTTIELRQRRRLRRYVTTIETTARYGRPTLVRR